MVQNLNIRPTKKIYESQMVIQLRDKAIEKIKSSLLPDDKIMKIILIGSAVKNSFGEYDPPGFRGSIYSDFDFIVFVDDDYQIPQWLDRELKGKPFKNPNLNLAYRNKKFIEDKYDVEFFFIRKSNWINPEIRKEGELAGIPMSFNSENKYLEVYP